MESEASESNGTSFEDALKYRKLPGFATTEGQDYEVKLSALLFVRGLNGGQDFKLGTNVAGAGALDDIVYTFTTPDQVCHTAFIQLKHKKTTRVNMDSLVNSRGDFSLIKYFESFMDIKQLTELGHEIESCHFGIFTNAPLHRGKGRVKTRDLPSPVDEYIKLNEVEANFTEHLVERIYLDLCREEEKQKKPLKYSISSNEDDVKNFLRRFKLFTGQPSENQLDDVIKKEIKKFGIETDLDAVYRLFLERLKAWWQQSEGVFLNQNSTILLEARAEAMLPHVKKLTKLKKRKLKLDVKFLESSTADIRSACADRSLVNVVSEYSARLTASKVLQILEPQRDSYILLGTEALLKESRAVKSAWSHGKKHLLVVINEESTNHENVNDIIAELSQVLNDKKDKKMILISAPNDSFATQLKEKLGGEVHIFQDSFHLSQLDPKSIKSILEKQVVLQGTPTTLGAMVGDDLDNITNEFKDVLETIIASETLVIGDELKEVISYHMPRKMQRNRVIKKQIFSDENYAGRIIIFSKSMEDVHYFVQTETCINKNKVTQYGDVLLFKADDGDKCKGRNDNTCDDVHYLELVDGRLVWKKTEGDINMIKKYIDEEVLETIEDPEERVVLLIAEPGMGKTTQLVHEAQQFKQKHPNCWVLPVSLNEHATVLAKTKKEELNAEAFLYSAMGIGKMSALAEAMFKFCLNHTGNMMVLIDGCDEVAPKYTEQCLALVQSLVKTKAKKVWVASRHSLKSNLESHLSVLSTGLRKFNRDDQRGFLVKYWKEHGDVTLSIPELDSFIEKVLTLTAESINDGVNGLMGIPLQTRMLGEVFQDHLSGKDVSLPSKLNSLELMEKFVEKKCRTYCERTLKRNKTDPDFELLMNEQLELFYEKHSTTALVLLFEEGEYQSLTNSFDANKCNKFMANIASGSDKMGIIDTIVDGKPMFVHRVFAEFFAAHWLSEHYQDNTKLVLLVLVGETFVVVRRMFNHILARDCELHDAVMNGDLTSVESLLKRGINVDATDKGGRTALHLATITGYENPVIGKDSFPILELLVTHKAREDIKDKVLHWTRSQYAAACMMPGRVLAAIGKLE